MVLVTRIPIAIDLRRRRRRSRMAVHVEHFTTDWASNVVHSMDWIAHPEDLKLFNWRAVSVLGMDWCVSGWYSLGQGAGHGATHRFVAIVVVGDGFCARKLLNGCFVHWWTVGMRVVRYRLV
jgi:hypothetical protein